MENKKKTVYYLMANGNVVLNCISSLMMICIVFCILQYSLNMRVANEASIQIEDGLAASCLAGLYIDVERYVNTFITGKTDIVVKDARASYDLFKQTLCQNLSLNNNELLQNVRVNKYIIYNISYNRSIIGDEAKIIDIYYFDNEGMINEEHKDYEDTYAPNGIKVNRTSVYADVLFDFNLMNGTSINCHRQLLTQAYKR